MATIDVAVSIVIDIGKNIGVWYSYIITQETQHNLWWNEVATIQKFVADEILVIIFVLLELYPNTLNKIIS